MISSILSKNEWKFLTLLYYGTSSRIVFVHFLGELKTPKRHLEINWPLKAILTALSTFILPDLISKNFTVLPWRSLKVGIVLCSLSWIDNLLDILWGQRIKLIQVVSSSEFHKYWWNNLETIFLLPAAFCRASEARTQSRP